MKKKFSKIYFQHKVKNSDFRKHVKKYSTLTMHCDETTQPTIKQYHSAMELEWMRCGLSKEKCLKLVEDFFGTFNFKHRAMSQKYSHVKFHPEDPENMFVFKVVID